VRHVRGRRLHIAKALPATVHRATVGYNGRVDIASWHRRVITAPPGVRATIARGVLRVLAGGYATAAAARNRWYDVRGPKVRVPLPVISVGNLTVGGTGKTPLVIELVSRLEALDRRPAVIARGFGSFSGQANEEQRLIERYAHNSVCICDPDRARAAHAANAQWKVDTIVLDDGFQHRRLHRDLDIVLVDATCPFGFGYLLPRGLLREPVHALARADVIVLTRCDQVSPDTRAALAVRLRQLAPAAIHLQCQHRVIAVENLKGGPLPVPWTGRRAVLFAGIGNPESFRKTVETLGIEVADVHWWPDHHRYRPEDLEFIRRERRLPPHDLLLTTEKDAVKLADLTAQDFAGLHVVKIAIDFLGDGDRMLQTVLCRTVDSNKTGAV